jgi:hypothetical protein
VIDLSKKETPEVQNKYLELEKDDLVNEVVQIKEALTASKVDVHSALGLEKAETKIDNSSSIEALTQLRSSIGEKIIALGGEIESHNSAPKQTEAEKKIYVEIEKLQQAQLQQKKAEVLAKDADFPVDVIENATIPTENKVTLMGSMIDVASRQTKAVDKVKDELDTTVKDETAKFSTTPETTEKKEEEITGKTYLSEMTGKLNFSDPIEQKTEEVKA